MKRKCVILLLTLLWTGFARPLQATSSSEVRSLAGLTTVYLLVEDFNLALRKAGFQKEQLYASAEKELKRNGFTIASPQNTGKVPLVYIRLSSVIGGAENDAPISFYLVVQVKQWAVLAHEVRFASLVASTRTKDPLLVTTWEHGTMAMVSRSELGFYMQNILVNLIDQLAQDRRGSSGDADGK
jgi:hypothetical protein